MGKRAATKPAKKPVVRHHPFERALTWAQNRLKKAEADRKKHYDAVVALDQEIPKLREIIRVHGGVAGKPEVKVVPYESRMPEGQQVLPRDREVLADIPLPHVPQDDPLAVADEMLKNLTKK